MGIFDEKTIDGEILRSILISGANNLFNHYPEVDALNVFPVPDGDTGTNMNLTITSGAKEIMNIRNGNVGEIAKIFSRGLLMGARGNSGVILSQIFRGFATRLAGCEKIDIQVFAEAWSKGKETAYKAILRPVEGTILTVIRESSEKLQAEYKSCSSIGEAMELLLNEAKESLARTPDMLPVLKEVGVVDSGGAGLVKVMEGMLLALKGEVVERKEISMPQTDNVPVTENKYEHEDFSYYVDIKLQVIQNKKKKELDFDRFKSLLESLGSNVEVVRSGDVINVKLDTPKPGVAINYSQLYGEFLSLSVVPGKGEREEVKKEKKKYAIIAVSVGDGLNEMFKSLSVDYIVSGGQSMNPSTQDFVKAIEAVNAENVYILPNNKNIFMAANQAKDVTASCKVYVIPTKTITEGLAAAMNFTTEVTPKENEQAMTDATLAIVSGQVTFAIKDTQIDDIMIHKDDYMGILGTKKIVASSTNMNDVCIALIKRMVSENSGLCTIIYGDSIKESEANELAKKITEVYGLETDVHNGGQPVYSYFFSVE